MSASHPNKLRPPTDRVYLAALAERLAAQCSLPRDVAHRRVADLAITAKPRAISDGGFSSRGGRWRAGALIESPERALQCFAIWSREQPFQRRLELTDQLRQMKQTDLI
jgi:hypothetical protein